ncbi:hypothetical protein LLG96_15085 [bacterium]|nr:hypothetical protein [bacterium]
MKRWTDKAIKQQIDELIEESYFLSLSDDEIRAFFRDFLDACEFVLRTNVSIHGDLRITKIKIALLKAGLITSESLVPILKTGRANDNTRPYHDIFVEQVLIAKRAITGLFEMLNPQAAELVLADVKKRTSRRIKRNNRKRTLVSVIVNVGFYVLLIGALFLVWFVGFR